MQAVGRKPAERGNMKIEVIATCGCVCNLRAEYNNVEQSLMDVEINIVTPCNYHAAQQSVQPTPPLALVCECGSLYGVHEEFCPKYKSAGG